MHILRGIIGILGLLMLCWLCGTRSRRLPWRALAWGIMLQVGLALLLTRFPIFYRALMSVNRLVLAISRASNEGTQFVFGYLSGGEAPFIMQEGISYISIFFFGPLMMLVTVGALSALLFHLGIMQKIVHLFARALSRTMNLGGAEGVAVAANVFMGQSDAPLLIAPYIRSLSRAQILCVMTAGMTTISGSLMVVFAQMLDSLLPGRIAGHLLLASIISAPAAVMAARLMLPVAPEEIDPTPPVIETHSHNIIEALLSGGKEGFNVAIQVAISLIVAIALVSLTNQALSAISGMWMAEPLTLSRIFGWIFAPLAWLMGIPWGEAQAAGSLLATKTVFNEVVAYSRLAEIGAALSPRSRLMMLYGLCGFANFSSIGICVGSLSALAPERRRDIAAVGFRAMIAGTLAAMMTGAVIGILQ